MIVEGLICGIASWYGAEFAGRRTASGERFSPQAYTVAHKSIPFGTTIVISNPANGKSVEAVVNDRGPFVKNRVLDTSEAIAEHLGFRNKGVTELCFQIL